MSAAFKEWAVVCEALGSGLQSIIIRKGGIAEGRTGFAFRHQEFVLFPTWFHEQLERTTLPPDTRVPEDPGDELEMQYSASVEWTGLLADRAKVAALRDLHILHDDVVEERFHYDGDDGVYVAFVRIYRLNPSLRLQNEKKYGGCRSWVELPDLEGSALVSVISDEEHARRKERLSAILGLSF
jgi:hypothetical protein